MGKKIRYTRLSVRDFIVRVKIHGRWKAAKIAKSSYIVPKAATAYKILKKTRGRSVLLKETKLARRRRKRPFHVGKKRLETSLRRRPPRPPKGERAELLLDYLKRVLGDNFGLSTGTLPQSLYHSKYRFFTDTKELVRKWLYVRIWFALESSGMSDGSILPAGEKAWAIDSMGVNLPSPGRKLSAKLLREYEAFANKTLFTAAENQSEQGWAVRHNADGRFKQWALSAVFLGVEGDFRRTSTAQATAKRFRARRKVSQAGKADRA